MLQKPEFTDLQSFPCRARSHYRLTAALPPRELLPRGPQGRDRLRQGDHFPPCAVATFSYNVTSVLRVKENKMENSVNAIMAALSGLLPRIKQSSKLRYQETKKKKLSVMRLTECQKFSLSLYAYYLFFFLLFYSS